jgi:hypothetical protein
MRFNEYFSIASEIDQLIVEAGGQLDDNTPYPATNLMILANKLLKMNVDNPSATQQVRRPREDGHRQLIVQYLGHFMNRIRQRNIDLVMVIENLQKFITKNLTKLIGTFNKAKHVEGIIHIKLPEKVESDDKDRQGNPIMSDILNIPYRYSTFGQQSPKKHVLTFITAKVKDNFVQNASPVHGETINLDFSF